MKPNSVFIRNKILVYFIALTMLLILISFVSGMVKLYIFISDVPILSLEEEKSDVGKKELDNVQTIIKVTSDEKMKILDTISDLGDQTIDVREKRDILNSLSKEPNTMVDSE